MVQGEGSVSALKALGEQAFLRLLTTQLRYQDPLSPMDNIEFVTQLAQFSQLEQSTDLNRRLSTSLEYLSSLQTYGAAGLIGKSVQVMGGAVSLPPGESAALTYHLADDAERVTLAVIDQLGQPVRILDQGPQAGGLRTATWDGRDDQGNPLPAGRYRYAVSSVDAAGNPIGATAFGTGRVSGVGFEDGATYFLVEGERVAASDVVRINP